MQGSGKDLIQPVLDNQLKAASPLLIPPKVTKSLAVCAYLQSQQVVLQAHVHVCFVHNTPSIFCIKATTAQNTMSVFLKNTLQKCASFAELDDLIARG